MEIEREVCAYLDSLAIPYEIIHHKRVSSIEECALPMSLLGALMPRNILLCPRNRSAFYLLIAHPRSVFKTSSVSKQVGSSRLSFAEDTDLSLLKTYSGALSPFGLMFDTEKRIQLLIDRSLLKEEYLLFHPLENTASVKIPTDDFIKRFLPSCGHTYIAVEMEKNETS